VRKIVALSDIYRLEAVAHALVDALEYGAFAADSSVHLLEQRARFTPKRTSCTSRGDPYRKDLLRVFARGIPAPGG